MVSGPRIPRDLLVIGFASLLLRLVAWAAAVWGKIPAVYDELGYLSRAQGWAELLTQLATSGFWDPAAWQNAYGDGYWPPLHPILLAPMVAFGAAFEPAARLVPVLLSTATTLLVFWLGLQIGGREVARVAAWLHALYPTFIGFSHFLWAESLSAFLLVALVCATLKADRSSRDRSGLSEGGLTGGKVEELKWSFLAGAIGGLGALTKAHALIFVPVVAVWLCRAVPFGRRRGLARAAAVVFGCGVLVLPWLGVLHQEEGRWVPLSTLGGFNLALGNNPWVPEGYGSSWGDDLSKSKMRVWIEREASRTDSDWRTVAGSLALEEMRRQPATTARRIVERIRMLWTADVWVGRHVLHGAYVGLYPAAPGGAYPELIQWAAVLTVTILALFFWMLLIRIGIGIFFGPRSADRTLLLVLAIAGSVAPALTLGFPRLHMPLLVMLLPFAAQKPTRPIRGAGWQPKVKAAALLALLVFSVSGSRQLGLYLNPSGLHSPAARALEPWIGPTLVSDRVLLRRNQAAQPWRIRAEGDQAAFLVTPITASGIPQAKILQSEVTWAPGQRWERLEVVSRAGEPIRIVVERPTGDPLAFDPVGPETRSWNELDTHSGLAFRWLGGGPGVLASSAMGD